MVSRRVVVLAAIDIDYVLIVEHERRETKQYESMIQKSYYIPNHYIHPLQTGFGAPINR